MAKPGPRPNNKAPAGIHIEFTDDERFVLTSMGTGNVKAKIRYLIGLEADRQKPKSKSECLSRWIALRTSARSQQRLTIKARENLVSVGFTEEEIQKYEEEMNEVEDHE